MCAARGRPTYLLASEPSLKSRETRRLSSGSGKTCKGDKRTSAVRELVENYGGRAFIHVIDIGASATCPWPVMIHWPDRTANAAPTYKRYRFPRGRTVARERISHYPDTQLAPESWETHNAPGDCITFVVGRILVTRWLCAWCKYREVRIVKTRETFCDFRRFLRTQVSLISLLDKTYMKTFWKIWFFHVDKKN